MQVANKGNQTCTQLKGSNARLGEAVARRHNQRSSKDLCGGSWAGLPPKTSGITVARLDTLLQRSLAQCFSLSACLEHNNTYLSRMLPTTCSLGLACAILQPVLDSNPPRPDMA